MPSKPLLAKTSQILYGGDYNPEQWPESVWEEDVRLMRRAGVNLVSLGIFSWAKLQSDENTFTFEWLDRGMDLLVKNGIWVDLATATASPPPWLSVRYPDVLAIDADGRTYYHGSRQHYSPSSPSYRKFAALLVEKIASRYAKHPALVAWHINNEYACHVHNCHGPASTEAFRAWLQKRYGSLEALNNAWGTAFWSQHYYDWSEVFTPRKTPTFVNPCQQLDFQRFFSDALLELCKMERDILRRITPDIPVTTNFMSFLKPLNYWDWAKEIDFTSWDSYPDPLPGQRGDLVASMGHDLTRSLKPGRPFVLMEQCTSHVNWRPVNATKPPGSMRLYSLQAVARGGDGVLFFQWRQSIRGAEKFHGAMVQHAPAEKSRVFQEVCALGAELKKLGQVTGSLIRSRVAVIVDWHAWWALEMPSKPTEFNYQSSVAQFHRYFYENNIAVDFVTPDTNLSSYALVVAPTLYLLQEKDAQNLDAYVRKGGAILVTCFSGIVDRDDNVLPGGYPGYLTKTLGLWVEEWFPLGLDEKRIVQFGKGKKLSARKWSEVVHLEGAKALATFQEGYLKGRAALTRNSLGKGEALYLATELNTKDLSYFLDALIRDIDIKAPLSVPTKVEVTLRENGKKRFLFLLNHNKKPVRIDLKKNSGLELLTHKKIKRQIQLPALGVAVIELD
ncbi:MAG: beta-galactosidase [Methylacidiphilales bacterium]|nr:beta-galactosidase [Candidatus Methylacidiphilales bacterium]